MREKLQELNWFLLVIVLQFTFSTLVTSASSNSGVNNYVNYSTDARSSATTSQKLDRVFEPKFYPNGAVKRSGIGIEKGPPDLQFGLAFTVPFVSLSTDKLLSQVSAHRGYDSLWDLASVLKLNVGGLAVAAVVGMAALLFLPAIFPGILGRIFGGGHGGSGAWQGNNFGGFFPGVFEHFMPGLGFNKPLGYGQSYDKNTYPFTNNGNDPYYGAYSERKEQEGKSRALKDDPNLTNQTSNLWSHIFREVRNTAKEYETCALYAICQRGRNYTQDSTNHNASIYDGRASRREGDGSDSHPEDSMSTFDHIFSAVRGIGGDAVPGLVHFQTAFQNGKTGQDCTKYYKRCPLSNFPIDKMVENLGEYVFN